MYISRVGRVLKEVKLIYLRGAWLEAQVELHFPECRCSDNGPILSPVGEDTARIQTKLNCTEHYICNGYLNPRYDPRIKVFHKHFAW